MADAVLRGRNRVMGVSTFLKSEYGLSNIAIGVPVVLGRNGVETILDLKLEPEIEAAFQKSASVIKESLRKLHY